ncbi:MAG: ABC transporter permease [Chloroflexi bacterium]|nr:ABC transporter permease [Chloroflexota bacterium]
MKNLLGIYTIWYRDLLRFWHDKMRMVSSVVFPLLFLFVFGSGLSARMGLLGPGINFSQFMFPGIIGMTVLMSSFASGVSIVWDREFGFLKEVLVAPVSRATVATGKAFGGATVALIQGTLTLAFSPLIGVSLTPLKILQLLPLMLLLATAMASMGILLATRIRSMEAFQAVMQMLMFPMTFLSGVFFPLQGLPAWMDFLTKINPATYGIAPIREVMLGTLPGSPFAVTLFGHVMTLWENIGVMAGFGAIMLVLAMWSFSHQE